MTDKHKTTLRIDWFDGTIIEDTTTSATPSGLEDEEKETSTSRPQYTEKKLMGFKRLNELSHQEVSNLTLQLSGRSSFWDLLDSELKPDYIVLINKILAKLLRSLQTGQKSVMVANLLKSRLLTSKFLDVLTDYVLSLPRVRIVEKRMNMQLWSDVETFYRDVLDVCEGICALAPGKTGEILLNLLEAVRMSVLGVIEEHTEKFSEEFFLIMDRLQDKIGQVMSKALRDGPMSSTKQLAQDENSFRNLNIFPQKEDLLGTALCDIKPNIVNGAYASVEHYLDVQFKLLREDCFGPLREGISKYMENPMKRRHENIRVHPKVRIIRTYVSNNKVGYLVDIAWKERSEQTSVDGQKYAYNKQLMFGSLVLFTSDGFDSVICATVLDSSMNLLRDGYLAVSFHSPVSSKIFTEPYLMVESEVFFEPYHRVLKVLQGWDDDIPMKRYVVDVQPNSRPPIYLTQETIYTLPQTSGETSFLVLDTKQWPPEDHFGLDQSQMEAFKLALTREFAVIQGPPGTGKTFIGIKVATTILQNLSLEGTPMLVICYTNHALDQFLEGILQVTDNIMRLGSQSRNPKIEPYTLNNLRTKSRSKYSYLYSSKRQEQEELFQQMIEVQTDIEKCEKEILSYDTLKPYLGFELRQSKEEPVLKWLFEDSKDVKMESIDSEDDVLDDWEKQLEQEIEEKTKIESCFSERWALKEIDSLTNSIKYIKDVTDDHVEGEKMADKFQEQIEKIQQRLSQFKNYQRMLQNVTETVNKRKQVKDPYSLSSKEKWSAYFDATAAIKDNLMVSINELQAKHKLCTEEQEEIATLLDAEVVKTARVVGVTTTAAARRHDLLQTLRSHIVIIEEAAEVLEAHIVASLTHHCQHVVLIGDHKQLRPTTSLYRLAKEFNLGISLFERMIRNGVHARTLTTQRRMRPEFVRLLVPTVYETLDCHPSVLKYGDVRGMGSNLFFCSHDVFEDVMADEGHSHRNTLEARWCVALANYLRHRNYRTADIVLLATYAGQAALIKELSKTYEKLRDVKVTVVDNYQGEESRIVILSLVRSNRDGKIGFLAARNRVCVALSRAKEGFYIFGNMPVLKRASPVWNAINDTLESLRAIGKALPLRCDIHTDNVLHIENADGFDNCFLGTCLSICKTKENT